MPNFAHIPTLGCQPGSVEFNPWLTHRSSASSGGTLVGNKMIPWLDRYRHDPRRFTTFSKYKEQVLVCVWDGEAVQGSVVETEGDDPAGIVNMVFRTLKINPNDYSHRIAARKFSPQGPREQQQGSSKKRQMLSKNTEATDVFYFSPGLEALGVRDLDKWVEPSGSRQPKFVLFLYPKATAKENQTPRGRDSGKSASRKKVTQRVKDLLRGGKAKLAPGYYEVDLGDVDYLMDQLSLGTDRLEYLVTRTNNPEDYANPEMVDAVGDKIYLVYV